MASTSLSLGPHWEAFIKAQVDSGRYASASEVIREALRGMEEHHQRLVALRAEISAGLDDAQAGRFASQSFFDSLIEEIDAIA